ncbi:MAG: galactosyldiacylglycerol synthase [Acidobacteria bacterium]|nr:galactosyldiacylglycerol synthase [Acidobacteriota bacterium]MBS1865716.1 galactosyldiacylglycerol synthase [Acidobacteriota bacterium]
MKKILVVFHDAGGGHRNAAVALQAMAAAQQRDWDVELVQFQELTDRLDVLKKLTGIQIQEQYNTILRNGWTWGSQFLLRVLQLTIRIFHGPLVKLLEEFWKQRPADMLISVIPHFNREIAESWEKSYPGRPFVTLITDLADFPPRFWIEPVKEQFVIAGTEKAVEQARAFGKDDAHIFGVSGMVLRPEFYAESDVDTVAVKRELELRDDLPTAMVLFGGFGSKVMYEIAEKIDAASLPVQLILICGKNEKLARRLKVKKWNIGTSVIGFTKEVHKLMHAADFLIGKPGPGSIAEAMQRRLPVIVDCNSWTLPQERYNAEWVTEKRVGVVLKSFEDVVIGVQQMLEPARLAEFKRNVAAQDNRAIFEIMEILENLTGPGGKGLQAFDLRDDVLVP